MSKNDTITIAVSKGRILKESLPLLERAGIKTLNNTEPSRSLAIQTSEDIKLLIIRATDVPTYVQHGGADVGIAGKDVLLEYNNEGIYESLDLGVAKCQLMLAGPVDQKDISGRVVKVATKYVNTTQKYFAARGQQVEVIKLYGSMELAPVTGLSDYIVDLVDTGNTLKDNGLAPIEKIADVSSRLIVNKAAMKIKNTRISNLIERLEAAIKKTE
ncbi:MAG: ATP phosphoribosyltransferase [Pseudomonadota bacterium]